MARRGSRSLAPGPRAGSVLLGGGRSGSRRRRGGRRRPVGGGFGSGGVARVLGVLVVLAAVAGGVLGWRSPANRDGGGGRAGRFVTGWGGGGVCGGAHPRQ